jgi:hypothetical protein
VTEIHKAQMIERAKDLLGLHGKRLSEDEADAYHVSKIGFRFYKWFIEKSITETDLEPYEYKSFCGKHTFTRGMKKGVTEYTGFIYRENEMFFDYKKLNRLTLESRPTPV